MFKHLARACLTVNLVKCECVQGNSKILRKGQVQHTVVGLMRWCLFLQPFNLDIQHIKRCENIVTCSALSGSDSVNVFFQLCPTLHS